MPDPCPHCGRPADEDEALAAIMALLPTEEDICAALAVPAEVLGLSPLRDVYSAYAADRAAAKYEEKVRKMQREIW